MVTLNLTDAEVQLLRSSIVRAIWTDADDAHWIEDWIESEDGVYLASTETPEMSRIIRKLLEAVK